MNGPGPAGHTRDAVVVIRLWLEPHDSRARATLLADTAGSGEPGAPGDPMVGLNEILAAVAARVREFAERAE